MQRQPVCQELRVKQTGRLITITPSVFLNGLLFELVIEVLQEEDSTEKGRVREDKAGNFGQ